MTAITIGFFPSKRWSAVGIALQYFFLHLRLHGHGEDASHYRRKNTKLCGRDFKNNPKRSKPKDRWDKSYPDTRPLKILPAHDSLYLFNELGDLVPEKNIHVCVNDILNLSGMRKEG